MKMIFGFILSLMLIGCNKGEEEIFVIPKNYTGYIVIIYNQKGGVKPKYENNKRVYEIPENGILKSQLAPNYGWTNYPEFYYEAITSESKIQFTAEPQKIPMDKVVAYGGVSGNANKDLAGKETVEYVLFYIGNNVQIDTAYEAADKLDIVKLAE
jgi:hypothetical protein